MDVSEKKTSKLESLKDFWDRKKGVLAVTATATTIGMVAICRAQNKQFEKFLGEHDLKEEFWKFIGADEEEIAEFLNNPL
jgi:hypothetical protein